MAKLRPTEPPPGEKKAVLTPTSVEQRAAGVAVIDRRVDLDVVVERGFADVAVQCADDAGGDRAAEAERVADGDDGVARHQLAAVAEGDRRHRRGDVHLQECEVHALHLADQAGLQETLILGHHGDVVGALDDMTVGNDIAGRIDDEAGALRLLADELRRSLAVLGGLLRGGADVDADHAGQQFGHHRAEAGGRRVGGQRRQRDGEGHAQARGQDTR